MHGALFQPGDGQLLRQHQISLHQRQRQRDQDADDAGAEGDVEAAERRRQELQRGDLIALQERPHGAQRLHQTGEGADQPHQHRHRDEVASEVGAAALLGFGRRRQRLAIDAHTFGLEA